MEIERATEAGDDLLEALARLVPQLSRSSAPPARAELRELLAGEATTLLVAREEGRILGALTLVVFRLPTGLKARIEDVVVDGSARGKGAGEALTREALRLAAGAGARQVELTSNPSREAANRLYRRLGFEPHETNVYRFTL